ncbi:MAG: helix-turn-helix domain-containing protein [Bacillota bacterium]
MLGDRVKQLRRNNNLSVRQLARIVGVTASFIYQLEQNKVSPSFSTLKSIAGALNTNMAMLVDDELPEEWVVVRKNKRKRVITDDTRLKLELLTFLGARNKKMQPLVFEVDVASNVMMPSLPGEHEDFLYILSGEAEITVNKAKYRLEEGDAAYFMFDNPAVISNVGNEKVKGLWLICPPGI